MISPSISSAVKALQTACTAATPIALAPRSTLIPLQAQAENLLTTIRTAIPNSAGTLDGIDPAGMPPVIVAEFRALFGYASDQYALVDLEGFIGRAATNLEQLGL